MQKLALWGLLATPLAFAALPLYIHLPHYYGETLHISLTTLGLVLLLTRLCDAITDPWIGRFVDLLFTVKQSWLWPSIVLAASFLMLGFYLLWHPLNPSAALFWPYTVFALLLTYLGYSALTLIHQAWGVRFSGSVSFRAKLNATREAYTLLGIVTAAALPALLTSVPIGTPLVILLFALLCIALYGLRQQPLSDLPTTAEQLTASVPSPWRLSSFRHLALIYALGGLASSWTATLMPFYVSRLISHNQSTFAVYLLLYFASAALSMPLWLMLIRRFGLKNCWLAGSVLSLVSFMLVYLLPTPYRMLGFALVCIATGMAVATDLVVPTSLLTGLIAKCGLTGLVEGQFLGWWVLVQKLSLAFAAGLALFALGQTDALVALYVFVPLALKGLAIAALLIYPTHE